MVVKIPRFNFEKFPHADRTLTTSMRSVGEVMAIGRTFSEAYLKALRSMEAGRLALEPVDLPQEKEEREKVLDEALRVPRPDRPWYVAQAFREGMTVEQVHALSAIDPWFLRKIEELVQRAQALQEFGRLDQLPDDVLREAKAHGFSDKYLGQLLGLPGGRGARAPAGPRHPPRLQAGGHLRRRVRGLHALPVLHL